MSAMFTRRWGYAAGPRVATVDRHGVAVDSTRPAVVDVLFDERWVWSFQSERDTRKVWRLRSGPDRLAAWPD
jgi:hypothetical protein